MKKLKRVGITGRFSNKIAVRAARKVVKLLERKKVEFFVDERFPVVEKNLIPLPKFKVDVILSFGGDGTFLRAFRALKKDIPVIGVNCGRLGYLLDLDSKTIERELPAILNGEYYFEKRTRLQSEVDGKKLPLALNEVAIVPEMAGRLIKYNLQIDGELRIEEGSDGLIVATPTGSTGHSLSAGGPIIRGKAKVLVITPINPINWSDRPTVLDDDTVVKVTRIVKEGFEVIIDGQERHQMERRVVIKKGKPVTFLRKKL